MLSNKNENWVLATAGITEGPLRDASVRLLNQAREFKEFSAFVQITEDNIHETCPATFAAYGDYLNKETRGYGYYAWKAEVIHRCLQGVFGECDGVVWIDAGCEMNINLLSTQIMGRIFNSAIKNGGWFYEIQTPEELYTKRDVIMRFPSIREIRPGNQVQANFFVMHGERGEELARRWKYLALEKISNLDFSPSTLGESESFVEHRNDQSLLSVLVKSMDYQVSRFVPPSKPQSILGTVKGLISPVWIARNRSGDSIIPRRGRKND